MIMITALIVSAFMSVAQSAQPVFTIDQLSWLAGCWQGASPGREYRERWSKPAGGMMMGTSQTVRDGRTVEYEFLQLRGSQDGVYYVAKPSGQVEAAFKLIEVGPQNAIFENKQHDFPQRILYRLGAARGVDFPMMRTACDEP